MADDTLEILADNQPVDVSYQEERIDVHTALETVHIQNIDSPITVTIKEEKPIFMTPSTGGSGWPFGANPNKVEGIAKDVTTILDRAVMPDRYRVVKWMIHLADDANGLAVTSELTCMKQGETILFSEFFTLGDA